ncbi:gamma-glutamylcyclotransferase family protein [Devosia sp.]|uniref:gamma-glutamylcyclotransferase family protein n=1 Tax=Devosia sp. TaxID=1871048 RepID=UPI003A8EC9B5
MRTSDQTPEPVLYFAYGSNIATARLRQRTPSCLPLGIATLPGHVLRFHKRSADGSGKCNALATSADSQVIGVLYHLEPAELPRLDAAEGVGKGYTRDTVTVVDAAGQHREALTYRAMPGHIDDSLEPYGWYKAYVLAGAREHGLPQDYVETFILPVVATDDPDRARDARERATLESAAR